MTGRPSLYSEDLTETICRRIAGGESLRAICRGPEMPDRETVRHWLDSFPAFSAKWARAREFQADVMDDLILETAEACTPETATADRVKIGAYQWRASKLAPRAYGETRRHEVGGIDGAPIQHEVREVVDISQLDEEGRARLRDLMESARASKALNVTPGGG